MSDNSAIEWTDSTWTPIRARGELGRHFCLKISPGCDHCYASTLTQRFGGRAYAEVSASNVQVAREFVRDGEIVLDADVVDQPLRWRRPRRVFVCSMTDLFGEWVPDEWIARVFAIMAQAPHHTFQLLTKRPTRMRDLLTSSAFERELRAWLLAYSAERDDLQLGDLLAHVWLGTSIELDRYTWRARVLAEIPAAVRFVSAEPLLGPLPSLDLTGIDWLITGGESGAGHRPIHGDWVRELRDRCVAGGVAFFHKQWGGLTPRAGGRILDGRTWDQYPDGAGGIVETREAQGG